MSLSKALIVLLATRHGLYKQLERLDSHAAAARTSPFFRTRTGHAATMGHSIEGIEGQIADVNRQLGAIRSRIRDGGPIVDSC